MQFVLPPWDHPAASENEVCFVTYCNSSNQIPDEDKTDDGKFFYTNAFEIRQDPSSHHLLMQIPIDTFGGNDVDPSLVSNWACMGGGGADQSCDPLDAGNCGSGVCAGPVEASSGSRAAPEVNPITFSGTQQAQFGRENYLLPHTEKVMCDTTLLPQGARFTGMNSPTHKHGKHFWYELPSGEHIYDSYVYSDPLQKYFDPPLAFDSEDPEERRLKFCALFNNGVDGAGDDAACDSTPGAGDGFCNACPIVGGVTTENEMFGPSISYFVQP